MKRGMITSCICDEKSGTKASQLADDFLFEIKKSAGISRPPFNSTSLLMVSKRKFPAKSGGIFS